MKENNRNTSPRERSAVPSIILNNFAGAGRRPNRHLVPVFLVWTFAKVPKPEASKLLAGD